jgi:uncharacterized protein (TIGR02646 family)
LIPISLQPEPHDFPARVREPGQRFLATTPRPTSKQWKNKEYWQDVIDDLYESYDGICAYSGEWIPCTTGDPTVDHYIPKSVNPQQAYEWDNFRLACLRFNRWKREFQDVVDPFTVAENSFQLLFPSLQVVPNPDLLNMDKERVVATIKRLRLNNGLCIKARRRWVIPLSQGKITFEFVKEKAPFLAHEMERQDLVDKIAQVMGIV